MLKKINKYFLKNKTGKYIALGSFTFFFIKGLVWLGILLLAGLNFLNFD